VANIGKGSETMNRWLTVVIFALVVGAGCDVAIHSPEHIAEQQDRRQLCSSLIDSRRSILESMFEIELYDASDKTDEWHRALENLEVSTSDSGGHPRSPSSVLQSAIDKLVQVKNNADRMRLEYLLLGSRMSLRERRQFDNYCVAGAK
jgi:hypothetical protein